MSIYLGTLTQRSVDPASPVLLTKNGPLRTFHSLIIFDLNVQDKFK